jgi:hypothetical protein
MGLSGSNDDSGFIVNSQSGAIKSGSQKQPVSLVDGCCFLC